MILDLETWMNLRRFRALQAAGAAALVQRAEGDTLGYRDFLDLVLEEEIGRREGRRFRNALKLSGLPHH